ncbi:25723_t:CDS:1 [Dentiscutata erythropus]|uniref:25723_t:CDS:1 n=1 Tax=Dentiscutata erythropus TaxID=1348616 RepID=A0A9N9I9E3_9GLOM|nr:25723_t:CDS:1 [Dentiscutata erythropus]
MISNIISTQFGLTISNITSTSPLLMNNFYKNNKHLENQSQFKTKQQSLQSLLVSNYTNSLCNIHNEYSNIYMTHIKSNRSKEYHYKVLCLGYYSSHIKITKKTTINRVCYSISTDYMICLNISGVEATCLTEYQFNRKVKFIVSWVSNKNKEESVASEQFASYAAQLFLEINFIFY